MIGLILDWRALSYILDVVELVVSLVFTVAGVAVVMCISDALFVLVLLVDGLGEIPYFYLLPSVIPLFRSSVIPLFRYSFLCC